MTGANKPSQPALPRAARILREKPLSGWGRKGCGLGPEEKTHDVMWDQVEGTGPRDPLALVVGASTRFIYILEL